MIQHPIFEWLLLFSGKDLKPSQKLVSPHIQLIPNCISVFPHYLLGDLLGFSWKWALVQHSNPFQRSFLLVIICNLKTEKHYVKYTPSIVRSGGTESSERNCVNTDKCLWGFYFQSLNIPYSHSGNELGDQVWCS